MKYTNWAKGHPSKYTSMVLNKHNKTSNVVHWKGVWAGSFKEYPKNAYAFIWVNIGRGMITVLKWKKACINLCITHFNIELKRTKLTSHTDTKLIWI
jgi:hypothetical protein